jgi:hypothetical protein
MSISTIENPSIFMTSFPFLPRECFHNVLCDVYLPKHEDEEKRKKMHKIEFQVLLHA